MKYRYQTVGTCSQQIDFGGCNGNLKGIGRLVEGMPVADVISRLEGIQCGMKSTSCPDQLATALKKVMAKRNANG